MAKPIVRSDKPFLLLTDSGYYSNIFKKHFPENVKEIYISDF